MKVLFGATRSNLSERRRPHVAVAWSPDLGSTPSCFSLITNRLTASLQVEY